MIRKSKKSPFWVPGDSSRMRAWCGLAAAVQILAPGLCAQTDAPKPIPAAVENVKPKAQPVRQKFVPSPAGSSKGNGANWSALHHFADDDPDVLMLMAHAGVGDSFPVQEDGKPKIFDVKVLAGDDDQLEIEIHGEKKTEKRKLRRDSSERIDLGEFKYLLSYPSVTVASDGKDTTDTAMLIINRIPLNSASATSMPGGVLLYSMRFNGGNLLMLQDTLRRAFPKDNVVLGASAERGRLPSFEIRNVRLNELARTIEFLSEGSLSVEAVEKDAHTPGNVWRIGGKRSPGGPASVKMRSVGAPNLFADAKKLERFVASAMEMEERRQIVIEAPLRESGDDRQTLPTRMQQLSEQKVFVLIGSEDGVAGMESFIKACEQLAADEAAKTAARLAAEAAEVRSKTPRN